MQIKIPSFRKWDVRDELRSEGKSRGWRESEAGLLSDRYPSYFLYVGHFALCVRDRVDVENVQGALKFISYLSCLVLQKEYLEQLHEGP